MVNRLHKNRDLERRLQAFPCVESRGDRVEQERTSDCLEVGGEDEDLDEPQAQQRVLVLPDDRGDQQELSVAGQQ